MKTKNTLKTIAFCIIAYNVALLSSCSTSSQLSSQNPHHHLTLVRADTHPLPNDRKENINTASDIIPISEQSSLSFYKPNNQPPKLNELLKSDMKIVTKQAKKSNPEIYRQIKNINLPKDLRQLAANSSTNTKSSVTKTAHWNGGAGRYFGLFILFLLLALLFWILSAGGGLFGLLGFISSIAAVIFFILWIVALASE